MEYAKLYPFGEQLTKEEKACIEQSCYKETYEKEMLMHRSKGNCKGLTSTLIGLIVMALYKPRTWCSFCPMGTMTAFSEVKPVFSASPVICA